MAQTAARIVVPERRVIRSFEILPQLCAYLALLLGTVVFLGWVLDIPQVKGTAPGLLPVPPISGVATILTALALLLVRRKVEDPFHRTATVASGLIALMVFGLGVATALQYGLGQDYGIDRLFFPEAVSSAGGTRPGRMATNSAAGFMFVALGLLLVPIDRRTNGLWSQVAAFGALVIAFIALVGYAFGVRDFYSMQQVAGMSIISAVALLVLGLGVLFSHLDRGLPSLVADEGAAGVVARRLFPGAILLPLVFGMLRQYGENAGLFSTQLGNSIFAVADVLAFVLLVAWSARVLRTTDQKRAELFVMEREAREAAERARTDAETARAEAEAARTEAEGANRAKSDFLAIMSHELRTPLSAIMGYQELLADEISGPVNEQQAQQLGRIKASARHLLSLIDEILTFTRIDAGREEINLERVSLMDIVREAAELIEPIADAKQLALEILPPKADIVLVTDPTKVRQMVTNLLSNAVKFTDRGKVVVTAEQTEAEVLIRIIDTGIGIAEEHIDRVFEPFWQVEQQATRRAGGTGLGLTVTRRLVTLLGGTISVKSTPGEGTAFTISLPFRAAEASPLIARAAALRAG